MNTVSPVLLFCLDVFPPRGRESTEDKYVPDVFFMEKDKYGNEIKKVRSETTEFGSCVFCAPDGWERLLAGGGSVSDPDPHLSALKKDARILRASKNSEQYRYQCHCTSLKKLHIYYY